MRKIYLQLFIALFILFQFTCIQPLHAQCWSTLGSGTDSSTTYAYLVEAITQYNGNLIAGGLFTHAGGIPASNIASWNGSSWSALGTGVNYASYGGNDQNSVKVMAVYNSELYVAGGFDTAGGSSCPKFGKMERHFLVKRQYWKPLFCQRYPRYGSI